MPRPKPTNEELVAQYQAGDAEAFNVLLARNEGLVWKFVLKQFNRPSRNNLHTEDDLAQVGRFAFWRAARDFDTSHGTMFSTFAVCYMKHALLNEARKNNGIIHVPVAQCNRPHSEKFTAAKNLARDVASLSPAGGDLEISGNSSTEFEDAEVARAVTLRVNSTIDKLKPRLQMILRARMDGRTLKNIGDELRISKARVQQLDNQAKVEFACQYRLSGWVDAIIQ